MSAPWVNACYPPVIPGTKVHAAAVTPAVLWFLRWSWAMFYVALFVMVATVALQVKGRKFVWMMRRTKARLRGGLVAARPNFYRRRRSRIESYETLDIRAADPLGAVNASSGAPSSARRRVAVHNAGSAARTQNGPAAGRAHGATTSKDAPKRATKK